MNILELLDCPPNALLHPQHVIDALSLDVEVGLIETTITTDLNTGRGLTIYYDFTGFDAEGSALFNESETIAFTHSNHGEFIHAHDLRSMRDWLIKTMKGADQ